MNCRRSTVGWGRIQTGQAGFSLIEVIVAIAILAAVGLSIHQVMLSGMRSLQMGRERAAQARMMQAAMDWARGYPCELPRNEGQPLEEVIHGRTAVFQLIDTDGDPEGLVHRFEVELVGFEHAPPVRHHFLLNVKDCPT